VSEALPPDGEQAPAPAWEEEAALPYAYGPPPLRARLRAVAEDFWVDERPLYLPEGRGNQLWLRIEKRETNTEWVARRLAELVGVAAKEVGYAGLKDRHAVTRQWFSVPVSATETPPWGQWQEEFTVLEAVRNPTRLRRGGLAGNQFRILLRAPVGDLTTFQRRVALIASHGFPNYFGEQRFGHQGANLGRAEALFRGELRERDRHLRGLYLSAARSQLFNQVLARRVEQGSWGRALAGEHLLLASSHTHFIGRSDAPHVVAQLDAGQIHPSGPLWGSGAPQAKGEALALELAAVANSETLRRGLERAGLQQERRPLRVIPEGLRAAEQEGHLLLEFFLPAGSYATALLRELVAPAAGP